MARRLTLNLQYFSGEKTEKATPEKRQESKRKGQVAKSQEVPAALIMIGGIGVLSFLGGWMLDRILSIYRINFTQYMGWEWTPKNIRTLFEEMTFEAMLLMAPIMGVAIVFGVIGNFVQVGSMFTAEPLKAQLSRLDPIQGAKKIFAVRALVELAKSLAKIAIIGYAAFSVLWGEKDELFLLSQKTIGYSLVFIGKLTVRMALVAAIILLILAVFDYMYQKYEFEKGIKMSKQDIKDEYKKSEGDPLIKQKIKDRQRSMSMNRMIQELPGADVLIVNPTHYAIAIKYDAETMAAPTIIAMGKDHVALKLKEKAKELGIVMMENKPLARALYDQVEIGDPVPEELFVAVAEVLAYIYRLKGKIK